MNPLVPAPASADPALPLSARRCARHPGREAVARCPGCGAAFCRECVSEHAGRVLCAECLAREAAADRTAGRRRLERARSLAATGLGALVVWLAFYALAALLLKIPPELHEGTLWHRSVDNPDDEQ